MNRPLAPVPALPSLRAGAFKLVILSVCVVWSGGCLQRGDVGSGPGADIGRAELLLRNYHLVARSGDFAGAWSAHRQLVDHAKQHGLGEWLARNYCPTDDCADIGYVAWNLGKTKAELDVMGQWGCGESGVRETCAALERWVSIRKSYLSDAPTPPNHPAQEMDLSFLHAKDHGNHRPWTVVELGGTPLWGMLDTGSYGLVLQSDQDGLEGAVKVLGKAYSYMTPLGVHETHQSAVLSQFKLGSMVEKQVPALAVSDADNGYRDMAIIGTSVLFRYPRICFDWANRKLHLGRLGRCGEGVELDGVGLRSGASPVVRVHAPDGAPFDVLLDTGAHPTLCQERFVERMGGRRFRFGSHPDFQALCVIDSSHELHSVDSGVERFDLPALIGMDTLMKFDGFGWELNPFRVYLVPKSASKP